MILTYHGIVNDNCRPECLLEAQALPVACFRRHLKWLLRHRRIVALNEYLQLTKYGKSNVRNEVALTFDDGLASTFRYIYPILRAEGIPATFFISTSHLAGGPLLWFSYINAICFETVYDTITVNGHPLPLLSLEQRTSARRILVSMARTSGNIPAFCENLAATYPLPISVKAEYGGMSLEQLSLLGNCDFLEGGAHTVNHPFLDQLSYDEQAEEILTGKDRLSALTGKPVRYFAYPGGDYNHDTLRLVADAGFDACFAVRSRNLGTDERFEIPRVGFYSTSFLKFWLKVHGVNNASYHVKALQKSFRLLTTEG